MKKAKKTRKQMIDMLCLDITTWDRDFMIKNLQALQRQVCRKWSTKKLTQHYNVLARDFGWK